MSFDNFYKDRHVAITGGLGFLGSNLAHDLVRAGARVTLIDPMLPMYGGNLHNVEDIRDRVRINYADIRDEGALRVLLRDEDILFHIGAQTSHVDSMKEPLTDVDINCRGTILLLEACRTVNPGIKIVYAGTRAQYRAVKTTPVSEAHPCIPLDVYGADKLAAEHYCMIYHRVHGIRCTSLRISNTYGPRHQMKHAKYGIQNWMIRLAMDDETIRVYGDGGQLRDFNYVDDVSRAFLLAGSSEAADGEIFNLGSGNPITFRGMVETVVRIAGSGRIVTVDWPEERKRIETGDYVADFSRIREKLGWEPTVEFEAGLEKTITFYREHKNHYWND